MRTEAATHTSTDNTWSGPSSGTQPGCPPWCRGRSRDPLGNSPAGVASCFSCLKQKRASCSEAAGSPPRTPSAIRRSPPEALSVCISLSRRSSSAAFFSSSSCLFSSSAAPCGCSCARSNTRVNTPLKYNRCSIWGRRRRGHLSLRLRVRGRLLCGLHDGGLRADGGRRSSGRLWTDNRQDWGKLSSYTSERH